MVSEIPRHVHGDQLFGLYVLLDGHGGQGKIL